MVIVSIVDNELRKMRIVSRQGTRSERMSSTIKNRRVLWLFRYSIIVEGKLATNTN